MPNALMFDGRLAKAPALTRPNGRSVCKFTLLRNEYAGKAESGEARDERVVSIPFVAFGSHAEAIAAHAMEGDQLIIEARVDNNNYEAQGGEKRYDYNFIVNGFDFGAPGKLKREHLSRQAQA